MSPSSLSIVGASVVSGTLLVGSVPVLFNRNGRSMFLIEASNVIFIGAIALLIAAIACTFATATRAWSRKNFRGGSENSEAYTTIRKPWVTPALTINLFFLSISAYAFLQGSSLPAVGWDALGVWVNNAKLFISYSNDLWPHPTNGLNSSAHPHTISYVAATAAWGAGPNGWVALPWVAALLGSCISIFAYFKQYTNHYSLAFLGLGIFAFLPLIENHYLIYGYADFFLVATLICAVILISLGLTEKSMALMAIGLLIASSMMLIKNSGGILALTVVFSILIAQLAPRALLALLITTGLLFLAQTPSVVHQAIAILPLSSPTNLTFEMGARLWELDLVGIQKNQLTVITTLFKNSSFSLAFLLVVVATCNILRHRRPERHYVFTLSLYWIGILMYLLMLLFGYGREIATIHQDTGGSRVLLPFMSLAPLLLASFFVPSEARLSRRSLWQ